MHGPSESQCRNPGEQGSAARGLARGDAELGCVYPGNVVNERPGPFGVRTGPARIKVRFGKGKPSLEVGSGERRVVMDLGVSSERWR